MRAAPRRLIGIAALTAALATGLAQVALADEYVELGPSGFEPSLLIVDAGETIHFSSSRTGQWSVTADSGLFDSQTLPGHGGYSMRISVPGAHSYHSSSGGPAARLPGPAGRPR